MRSSTSSTSRVVAMTCSAGCMLRGWQMSRTCDSVARLSVAVFSSVTLSSAVYGVS